MENNTNVPVAYCPVELWQMFSALRWMPMTTNPISGHGLYKYLSGQDALFAGRPWRREWESRAALRFIATTMRMDTHEDLCSQRRTNQLYQVWPDLTALVARVNEGTFQLEDLAQGFRDIEQSDELYENLFEDIDLYSKKASKSKTKMVAAVMKELLC